MEERYLYEIHPVRPFVSPDGKEIKKACSIQLTKDEVKEYIKKCSVYRKFSGSNTKMERVTLSNLDELHVKDKGIVPVVESNTTVVEDTTSPDDEVNESDTVSEDTIDEAVQKESVVEETTDVSPEETTEEIIPDTQDTVEAVEEPVVEETADVSPEETTEEVAPNTQDTVEETVVNETVDDILKEGTVQSSNENYHHKNKKKHH